MNDEALIAAYYACDDEALATLVTRHEIELLGVFTDFGLSNDKAYDGFQGIWVRVISSKLGTAQRYDPARGTVLVWLRVIARSLALDILRKEGQVPGQLPRVEESGESFEDTIEGSEDAPDTDLLTQELRDAIRGCMDDLPSHQRGVLNLEEDRQEQDPVPSQQEWAVQHGLTFGQYISRLNKGRDALRACLRRRGFAGEDS